ncbi:MAG: DNA topoisomerase I [Methanomassiliicoccales archaeon]|nr:DNA topoisomerase I [Methanomassiliicoccales archaeon]
MRKLVISEKANAAVRIATILSNGSMKRRNLYGVPIFHFESGDDETDVVGLRGHILELDYSEDLNDWHKVDPADLVYAVPEKKVVARNIIGTLRKLASESDQIIIATDFDREGELIGLETVEQLDVDPSKVKRARFSALTKQEIDTAFSSLAEPDRRLAESAECRQIVDLAWGASLTRFISIASKQVGTNFLSVGRVQSPTLSLVVDKNKEILEFVKKPYWEVLARLEKNVQFTGIHRENPFWELKAAENVVSACEMSKTGRVTTFSREERDEYPPPPFNTTMMLAEANRLGLSASRAMSVAEDLYTSGFISYPRTDNTVYPKSLYLRGVLERLKESEFRKEAEELLSQKQLRPSRGRVMATDHPPIYPVEGATKRLLKGDKWTLYELIARRFMATVAPPAHVEHTDCSVSVGNEPFDAKGYRVLSQGWRGYYPYYRVLETALPQLHEGDEVAVLGVSSEMRETQPPSRYSQGTLIQEMERLGLGTKSTRHEIIQKLYDRNYVQGANLIPTPSGIAVASSLEEHAEMITESKMTAHLEKDMDDIAKGESTLGDVVRESQDMLSDVIETMGLHREEIGKEIRKALEEQQYVGKCPDCGGRLRMMRSRKGGEFIGCSNYPECKRAYPKPRGALVQPTEEKCELCGSPKLRVIRKGQPPLVHCIDPDCESNKKMTSMGKCPKCGNDLRILYSRAGKRFIGCSNYPKCERTYPLPQRGRISVLPKSCDVCGAPMIEVRNGGRSWRLCVDMECTSKKNGTAGTKKSEK